MAGAPARLVGGSLMPRPRRFFNRGRPKAMPPRSSVTIWFTAREHDYFIAEARRCNCSVSGFLRDVLRRNVFTTQLYPEGCEALVPRHDSSHNDESRGDFHDD